MRSRTRPELRSTLAYLRIDAAGNVGIIVFLFVLGLVFESSRATLSSTVWSNRWAKLAASNEELAHLNNEKTEFLGIAAHDLRNPLTVVIGMGDLMIQHRDPEVVENARMISSSGQRMLELITDLLDANAIEEGRYASQLEPHDLRVLIATSMQNNRLSSERKQITIALPAGLPCWVQADRKATLQILDNLISNALKYSPPGSHTALGLHGEGDWVEFSVADQGPGISAADQKKLFQKHIPAFSVPNYWRRSLHWLGLSIVKRLAGSNT